MKTIPQRELRNQSGEILCESEKGTSFLITVEGRPIALLTPYPKKQWVPRVEVMKLLATGKPDPRFFDDVAELGTPSPTSFPSTHGTSRTSSSFRN